MEILYLLLLVTLCRGLAIDPQLQDLQAPSLRRFATRIDPNDNSSSLAEVTWTKVESPDDEDPVIGYKLKVWEIQKVKRTTVSFQDDGAQIIMEEEVYPDIIRNKIPVGTPKVLLRPANETTATFPDLKVNIVYQFAVLAFTKKGEGPLSDPTRLKLHGDKDKKKE